MLRWIALLSLAAAPGLAAAAPRVAVDVAPVHSIATAVMEGLGAPDLIVPPGASPHGYGLRPSEAAALEAADLVVWVGPVLTPWLEGPLDALAPDARRLTLETAEGLRRLEVRGSGPFESPGEEHAGEDGAAEEGAGEEGAGEAINAHLWLDPRNAAAIAGMLAEALAEADPANAAAYRRNAAAFAAETEALEAEVAARLDPVRGGKYFVFHDAYPYFEARFGMPAAGSIALQDAEAPRAARVAEIRERFRTEAIDCVFAEPQFEPKLIGTLIEGTEVRTGTLDPMGAGLEPGRGLYAALLREMADGLADCLGPAS